MVRLKRHSAEINDNSSISPGWARFLRYVPRSIFSQSLSAWLSGHPVLTSFPHPFSLPLSFFLHSSLSLSLSPTISILSGIMKTNLWSVWCRAEKRSTVNVLHMGMRDFCEKVNQILTAAVESRRTEPYSVMEGILWVYVRFIRETKGHTCSVVFQGHTLRIEAWMMILNGAGSSGDRNGRRCVWKPRGNVGVINARSFSQTVQALCTVNRGLLMGWHHQIHCTATAGKDCSPCKNMTACRLCNCSVAKWVFVQSCKMPFNLFFNISVAGSFFCFVFGLSDCSDLSDIINEGSCERDSLPKTKVLSSFTNPQAIPIWFSFIRGTRNTKNVDALFHMLKANSSYVSIHWNATCA